jgi:glycosyltransferase involved in cell wall biosynthesis
MNQLDVVIDADVLGRERTGDETYVRELLTELGRLESGLQIGAVCREKALVPEGITPILLSGGNQIVRLSWGLPRLLKQISPRLAHFQYVIPPTYRGRAVVTVHDLSYELLPELEDRFDGWALRRLVPMSIRRALLVITGSEWTKRDIVVRYGVDPDRIVVAPDGVDARFRPDGERPARRSYVLFVGALRPRKDPLCALEAFRRLPGDLDLVMIGPDKGLGVQVREFIHEHGLGDRIEVLGYVSFPELLAYYRGAQCLILPSWYEGFGLPVVEAMASGTPVVSTTAGAIPEIAGDAAILLSPGNPDALADGIATALEDRTRLVAAGLERAKRFSWAETARRTLHTYISLL